MTGSPLEIYRTIGLAPELHLQALHAQREALMVARASGELRINFHTGGTRREVEFRSMADIDRAIASIDREIASLSGRRVRTITLHTSKGL